MSNERIVRGAEREIRENGGKQYFCKFCRRMFTNPQALGGHQNAHQKERKKQSEVFGKRKVPMAAELESSPYYNSPYSTQVPSIHRHYFPNSSLPRTLIPNPKLLAPSSYYPSTSWNAFTSRNNASTSQAGGAEWDDGELRFRMWQIQYRREREERLAIKDDGEDEEKSVDLNLKL